MQQSNNEIIINIPDYEGAGIYQLTNIDNGKKYIGSSINVKRRILQHLHSFQTLRCSDKFIADLEHGATFKADVLEAVPYGTDEFTLRQKESDYIAQERLWKHGYNYGPAGYINPKLKNSYIIQRPNKPKERYKTLSCKIQKTKYEEIQAHADQQGESMNQFVVRAINETMERDK